MYFFIVTVNSYGIGVENKRSHLKLSAIPLSHNDSGQVGQWSYTIIRYSQNSGDAYYYWG